MSLIKFSIVDINHEYESSNNKYTPFFKAFILLYLFYQVLNIKFVHPRSIFKRVSICRLGSRLLILKGEDWFFFSL